MPEQGRRRRIFGVLIDLIHTAYQETLVSGTADFCLENDIDLLCFVTGRPLGPDDREDRRDVICDLVDESRLDGLIVMTALENRMGQSAFLALLMEYSPLPIVSIGEKLPGYHSLVIDNEKGFTDLLDHLADVHGCRRLAFISGPRLNSDAQIRFNAYRAFLTDRSWAYDPALVVEGDFSGASGRAAVAALLDERKTDFDAIVACNDLMAGGAIDELALRGIDVPGGARVVGFDDLATSQDISLTTVRQPLQSQGRAAARLLLDVLEKKAPGDVVSLPTELVVRESCGCLAPLLAGCETAAVGSPGVVTAEAPASEAAARFRETPEWREWSARMRQALIDSWEQSSPAVFLRAWNLVAFEATKRRMDLSLLQEVVSTLRRTLIADSRDENRRRFYEDQFHRARIVLEEAVRKEESVRRTLEEIQEQKRYALGNRLSATRDVENLFDLLVVELPPLGIRSCFLSLFEPRPESARLVFAFDERGRIRPEEGGTVFRAKCLLPAGLTPPARRRTMSVHALVNQDRPFGFIVLECGDDLRCGGVLEFIRARTSVTLQYMLLIREITSQAAHLELFNKRLEQSNSALQEFAFVASHDLQEPLRKILTFGTRLEDHARQALAESDLDYLRRMRSAASRMQGLIDSLLSYSRVTTQAKPFTEVDLTQTIKDVLQDLEVQIERTGSNVSVQALPTVRADAMQMRQLFQNLIQNAIKFGRPGAPPQVRVYAVSPVSGTGSAVAVEDNGIGIDSRYTEKIFGIFQRLHGREEYEGSGIGLAICKKIMERHGGSITVKSAPGKGAAFIISFNVDA